MTQHLAGLPGPVIELLRSSVHSEFATLSSAGVPIDTPMMYFPTADLTSLDVATGLAYPSKAERARKNPKVGLLLEGTPSEPVISIAGRAAVRDSNLQANADRYLAETSFTRVGPAPWSLAKNAVWYWTRIIIEIAPAKILWWDSPDAMDLPPKEWRAPADFGFPVSDPVPPGALSGPPNWPHQKPWQDQARGVLAGGLPAHLSLCDDEGYPLPIRAHNVQLVDEALVMDVPKGAPWRPEGKATLTFAGLSTFVGDVTSTGGRTLLKVERALPVMPFMAEANELWEPGPDTYKTIMGRLNHETARRGQPIPTISDDEPALAPGALIRKARIAALNEPSSSDQIESARVAAAAAEQT